MINDLYVNLRAVLTDRSNLGETIEIIIVNKTIKESC